MKILILNVVFFFLFSCGLNPDDSGTPAQKAFRFLNMGTSFYLYPNDRAVGDSVKAHLPTGVLSVLQVGGKYRLTIQGNYSEPKLHIYNMVQAGENYNIKSDGTTYDLTKNADGSWSVSFTGSNQVEVLQSLLITDGKNQAAMPSSLTLSAQGDYGNHFSLHILVLADYFEQKSDSVQALKMAIRQAFDELYTPQGIVLDSIYVSSKKTHPKYAGQLANGKSFYLDHEKWIMGYYVNGQLKAMDFDELSNGFGAPYASAIQVALIDGVSSNSMIIGLSPYFGKSVYAGEASTIELSAYHGQTQSTTGEMARTLAHEFGHFVGLRHTTMSSAERKEDRSIFEDGLSDTPYERFCAANVGSGSKTPGRGVSWSFSDIAFSQDNCPDVTNLMFPFADPSYEQNVISPMQYEQARVNLSLLPR